MAPLFLFVMAAMGDTLLDNYFCDKYYPEDAAAQGLPPCEDVRQAVTSNLSRPFPTLELGDPTKPAMFFVHGWPDSGAEFAAQFGGFCFGPDAKYRCVAITWQNFHPDLPASPLEDLKLTVTFEKIAATMREASLVDTTFVIHDWGSFIGYQVMNLYPELMNRTISFDIGSGGHPNVTYQHLNVEAFETQDSALSESSAEYWQAPCVECASWRSTWPYVSNLSFRGYSPKSCPATKPLLFVWGNMTRGKPRGKDSLFFDQAWLNFVKTCPHGRVIEGTGDHWIFHENPKFVNRAIKDWLSSLRGEEAVIITAIGTETQAQDNGGDHVPAERVVGPTYKVDPLILDQGRPKGRRFSFKMPLRGSHSIFNGSDPALDPQSPPTLERDIWVNIPASYQDGAKAPVLMVQDGGYGDHTEWIDHVQSNLAGTDTPLPAFVTVAVANGGGSERSLEYNTMSDRYASFVTDEVLPAVLRRPDILAAYPNLKLASDPGARATMGCSAGGIAAITMAFFRPDLFTRVAAYSPAAVDLQVPKQPEKRAYPMGAREYWDGKRLIETQPKKPLRIFVNDNEFDLGWGGNCPAWVDREVGNTTAEYELGCWSTWDCSPPGYCADGFHGFALGGNRTAASLKAAGYEYQHVYGLNQWHCGNKYDKTKKRKEYDPSIWTETLATTLVWLWEGYE